jgi:hypothetical protein
MKYEVATHFPSIGRFCTKAEIFKKKKLHKTKFDKISPETKVNKNIRGNYEIKELQNILGVGSNLFHKIFIICL